MIAAGLLAWWLFGTAAPSVAHDPAPPLPVPTTEEEPFAEGAAWSAKLFESDTSDGGDSTCVEVTRGNGKGVVCGIANTSLPVNLIHNDWIDEPAVLIGVVAPEVERVTSDVAGWDAIPPLASSEILPEGYRVFAMELSHDGSQGAATVRGLDAEGNVVGAAQIRMERTESH